MSLSVQSLAQVRFAGRGTVRTQQRVRASRSCGRIVCDDDEIMSEAERRLVAEAFGTTGLAREDYRSSPLRRRMAAALRAARLTDAGACAEAIRHDPILREKILNTLLIGYTLPFRDVPVFERLRRRVLPAMLAARKTLRIWSAGCSQGMELYSVALLLAEQGRLADCHLRGSDTRSKAVAEAPRLGSTFWSALPERFAGLKQVGRHEFLRQAAQIEWRVEDVFSCQETDRYDLIFCRNLAIYLRPAAAERLWNIMARALVQGGLLVTGKAEKPLPTDKWRRVDPCIYRVVKP